MYAKFRGELDGTITEPFGGVNLLTMMMSAIASDNDEDDLPMRTRDRDGGNDTHHSLHSSDIVSLDIGYCCRQVRYLLKLAAAQPLIHIGLSDSMLSV